MIAALPTPGGLGTLPEGAPDPLQGSITLTATGNETAVVRGSEVIATIELPAGMAADAFGFVGEDGSVGTSASLSAADPNLVIDYRVPAGADALLPGTSNTTVIVHLSAADAAIVDAAGTRIDALRFDYATDHPFGIKHALMVALLLLALLLLLFLFLHSRFPRRAALNVDRGGSYDLRRLAERSFSGRWFGGQVYVGPGSSIETPNDRTIAVIRPRRGRFSLFSSTPTIVPIDAEGFSVAGEPLTAPRAFPLGSVLQGPNFRATYQIGDGQDADDAGWRDPYEPDDSPRYDLRSYGDDRGDR